MNKTKRTMMAVILGTALVGGGITAMNMLAGTAAPAGGGTPAAAQTGEQNERHPHIHSAIKALHEAMKEMKEADHDFKGHRVDAMKACEEAIKQLKMALEVDKK